MQGLNNRLTRSSSYEFWHDSNDMAPPLMVLVTPPPPPPLTTKGTAACMTTPEKRPIFSDEERCREEHNPEVVRCTSFTPSSDSNGSSFRRRSPLITVPPKNNKNSRLLSSPKTLKSEKKRRTRRAVTVASSSDDDEEDDDPFLEEDLPEEFKRWQISWFVVVEWVSLVLIVAALICNLTVPNMKVKKLWDLKLWKWEVMVLVLICGRLVSSWGIRILVVFFIERNFLLRKRVLYFVYGLKRGVVNSLWLGLVLLAWRLLFHKKLRQETNSKALEHVTGVLVCLLVGTIIWLVKTLIVKVLASSFHVSTYFDRIQDALFDQFIIKNLTGLPLIQEDDDGGGHMSQEKDCRKDFQSPDNLISENVILVEIEELQKIAETVAPPVGLITPTASPDLKKSNISNSRMTRSGRIDRSPRATVVADTITIDHLHRLTPRNVSAWNMKRLMHLVRHEKLVTLDEQLSNQSDESEIQINSASEAREAARKIFKNVAKRCSKYIYMEDLMRFMAEDEAVKTMSRFEGASDLKFSKKALKNWVVNVYRERRALALTLNDTKTAVNRLHHIVNAIVGLIIFIIWLLILGILSSKLLVLICSQLVLVAFVFGNSCKDVFESIIFLFVMHPFDVGDRCEIDHVEMIVEEMNILTTVFLRYDNLKITIPNGVLASKAISNYRRSPDMEERIEFSIHIATPTEKIAVMKQRITSYIEKKSEHWVPGPMIFFKNVEDLDKMKMAVWLCHRMNHHYMGEKWARRGLLVEEMIKIFKDLDINYHLLPVDIVKLQP